MSNCSHKIVNLLYSEKCKQIAALCNERCQNGNHSSGQHSYTSLDTIETKYNQINSNIQKQFQENKKSLQNLFIQTKNQLQAKYKESIEKLQNQKKGMIYVNSKNEQLFKKIENGRWQKLLCSQIHTIKKILFDQNLNVKWEKLKKVVDEFKKYTTTSTQGHATNLKNQISKLKDELKNIQGRDPDEKMVKMDIKLEAENKLRKENINLKTQIKVLQEQIARYKMKCGEVQEKQMCYQIDPDSEVQKRAPRNQVFEKDEKRQAQITSSQHLLQRDFSLPMIITVGKLFKNNSDNNLMIKQKHNLIKIQVSKQNNENNLMQQEKPNLVKIQENSFNENISRPKKKIQVAKPKANDEASLKK